MLLTVLAALVLVLVQARARVLARVWAQVWIGRREQTALLQMVWWRWSIGKRWERLSRLLIRALFSHFCVRCKCSLRTSFLCFLVIFVQCSLAFVAALVRPLFDSFDSIDQVTDNRT